ncbi:MAG: phosphatidate cytidylyltransferase [Candidatus Nanopelagicales bacterium]
MGKIKTGRNLPIAILVGLILISLVVFTLFINKYAFTFLALAAVLLAGYEVTSQLNDVKKINLSIFLNLSLISIFIIFSVLFEELGLFYALILSLIFIFVYSYGQKKFKQTLQLSSSTVLYLGIFGGLAMLMLNQSDGAERIFIFIALTALSDTGGYFSGILFGKHKLAPKISPKKSYEGLLGSILLSVLASISITPLFLDLNLLESIILGLVLPLTGTAGDLFESYVKRNLNIKDFSSLLPGHGGMADRIDSLAFNSLFSYLIFGIFLGF